MGSSKPDFSTAFDLMDDELTNAEKRLQERRDHSAANHTEEMPSGQTSETKIPGVLSARFRKPRSTIDNSTEYASREIETVRMRRHENRRSITLKVREDNERRFNQLYHQLQIRGDPRNKQDLADEALKLLFERYNES